MKTSEERAETRAKERVFDFARQAETWLPDQDPEIKRLILAVFAVDGSNLTLAGRKFTIDAPNPFPVLATAIQGIPTAKPRFEPINRGANNAQSTTFGGGFRATLATMS